MLPTHVCRKNLTEPSRIAYFKRTLSAYRYTTTIRIVFADRYLDQLNLRARLANIAILDRSPLLDLTDQQLSGWAWTVLSTYLDDVDKKLETFQPLLDRLELLRELINRKFLFKRLNFDRTDGFIVRDVDSRETLGPQSIVVR